MSTWTSGATEPGSSGSGLFDPNTRLTGMLSGGNGQCGPDGYSIYTRFKSSYTAGNLGQWLNTSGGCSYTLSPTSASFGPEASTGSVSVTAGSGCSWTASESESWISITSGSSGSGNGTVAYSVSANSSAGSRTGTITIGGEPFSVYQSGLSAAYMYYMPAFKPPSSYWSGIGMTNLSDTTSANTTVLIYSKSGLLLSSESKTITAGGQANFLIGTSLTSSGWIKVLSDQPLAGLNFQGYYISAGLYYLADVPFSSSLATVLVIPHVAQNTNWDTILYIANPNSTSASITITYTNKDGVSSVPAYTATIPGNGCIEVNMSTVQSGIVKGGSVKISSSQGVTAFALYNNLKTGNYSYTGINATPVP